MKFTPIKRRPAYMQVFEAIEEEILTGRLEDGDPIPTEMQLCGQFGVQRSTVREGIRLLEQAGLVRRDKGKRLSVARPRAEEAAENTSQHLRRHGVRFYDVWEAILAIQPETARLAAEKIQPEDLEELLRILDRLSAARTSDEVVNYGVAFLQAVAASTGNKVIIVMLRSLNLLARSSLRKVVDDLPDARQRILKAQKEIAKALANSDGKKRHPGWLNISKT